MKSESENFSNAIDFITYTRLPPIFSCFHAKLRRGENSNSLHSHLFTQTKMEVDMKSKRRYEGMNLDVSARRTVRATRKRTVEHNRFEQFSLLFLSFVDISFEHSSGSSWFSYKSQDGVVAPEHLVVA